MKSKLIIVLAVVGLLLGLGAGFVWWEVVRVSRQVDEIGTGIDYLYDLGGVRAVVYRQTHELLHFFLYDENRSLQEFYRLHNDIEGLLVKLRAEPGGERGAQSGGADAPAVQSIAETYRGLYGLVKRSIALKGGGNSADARKFFNSTVERNLDGFLEEIDRSMRDKADELVAAYDVVLMRMGALPWTGGADLRRVQGTRYSIQYYLAVDRLSRELHRELNEIVQYATTGEQQDLLEYREASASIDRTFEACRRIIRAQSRLGGESGGGPQTEIDDLRQEYDKLSTLIERVQNLRRSGSALQAYRLADQDLRHAADRGVLPRLDRIMVNSRAQIMLDHRVLLQSVFTAGVISVALITVLASLLFLLVYRLIRHLVTAIHALDRGAERIGSGELDYRIAVAPGDELGDLAASFNRMAAELQDSNEDLRSFIYNLSHDLRTPLVNIKGFSDELNRSLKEVAGCFEKHLPMLDEKDRQQIEPLMRRDIPEALTFVGSSVRRMDELIKAVLALSRIGHRALKFEFINMDELVRATLDTVAHRVQQGRIAVSVGALPDVVADRLVMEQCLMNLLDNAIKYLDPARPGTIEISGVRRDTETVFTVSDNGLGIAEEDLPKIFGLFRRVGRQNVPGEGLGLAYVRAQIRRQGGQAVCSSRLGAGSTFSISVPHNLAER